MARNASILAIILMFAIAAFIKAPAVRGGAPNLEATYHVLLTDTALAQSPASKHHFLPTVTLGGKENENYRWGAALQLPSGHSVYTSFPIVGFLAPHIFFEVTHQPASRDALFQFTLLVHALVVSLLALFLLRLMDAIGCRREVAWPAASAGVAIQIFASENLLGFGAVYWGQQLNQAVLLLSLLCVLEIVRNGIGASRGWMVLLLGLTLLGPWIEWTGVVFSGGVVLLFGWLGLRRRGYWALSAGVAAATAVSLVSMTAHYAAFAGWSETILAFRHRAGARSALSGSLFQLLVGYGVSYGLLLALGGVALASTWRRRLHWAPETRTLILQMLLVASVPLAENLLLVQHATQFSFDRIKATIPLAMLAALAWSGIEQQRRGQWIAALVLAVALAQNLLLYQHRVERHAAWAEIDRSNQRLVRSIAQRVALDCALIATNDPVRGYANLLLRRSIYERVSPDRFADYFADRRARRCGAVYLTSEFAFDDLPALREAIVWRDGRLSTITAD